MLSQCSGPRDVAAADTLYAEALERQDAADTVTWEDQVRSEAMQGRWM